MGARYLAERVHGVRGCLLGHQRPIGVWGRLTSLVRPSSHLSLSSNVVYLPGLRVHATATPIVADFTTTLCPPKPCLRLTCDWEWSIGTVLFTILRLRQWRWEWDGGSWPYPISYNDDSSCSLPDNIPAILTLYTFLQEIWPGQIHTVTRLIVLLMGVSRLLCDRSRQNFTATLTFADMSNNAP